MKCRDGSYRLRLYHAHEDQIETIQTALQIAREAGGGDFDAVALENICIFFLTTFSSTEN